jgi:hypothetical protein
MSFLAPNCLTAHCRTCLSPISGAPTPAPSRRARMRKPSCLISCSHSGPVGGVLAGDGRQGSMKLIAPLLRCNMAQPLTGLGRGGLVAAARQGRVQSVALVPPHRGFDGLRIGSLSYTNRLRVLSSYCG